MSADTAKSAEMKVEWAETSVKKATADRGSLVAVHFYDPGHPDIPLHSALRAGKIWVNERIAELRAHLSESGRAIVGRDGVISTPKMDISQIVEDARNAVKGKDLLEALKAFVNLDRGVNVKDLRERVIKRSQNSISALFSSVSMSQDGRVISKHPGINVSPDDDEIGIRSQMIQDYQIAVSFSRPMVYLACTGDFTFGTPLTGSRFYQSCQTVSHRAYRTGAALRQSIICRL